MMRILTFCIVIWALGSNVLSAQESLLGRIDMPEERSHTTASFKTTRVINLHSIENVGASTLDVKISHRFGFLSGGFYELFGLDQASIRIGMDYGLTDRLMIGAGRSSFEKTYDGFIKYRLLRQHQEGGSPLSLSYLATAAVETLRAPIGEEVSAASRWSYTHQLIIARKWSDAFTLQLSPTVVHRNQVTSAALKNDVYMLPIAARMKLSKRVSLNAEYVYILPDQIAEEFTEALSVGFDIETGGHVFQLQFSNATSMIEKGFLTETRGRWGDGDIHFGFNISRVF